MWLGEGWTKTRRIAGLIGLFAFGALDSSLTSFNVPVALYTLIGGLLGLDVLSEALDRVRPK